MENIRTKKEYEVLTKKMEGLLKNLNTLNPADLKKLDHERTDFQTSIRQPESLDKVAEYIYNLSKTES